MYAELCAALVVQWLFGTGRAGTAAVALLVAASAACYAYFAPWVYATPLTAQEHQVRRWMQGWD